MELVVLGGTVLSSTSSGSVAGCCAWVRGTVCWSGEAHWTGERIVKYYSGQVSTL